MREMALYRVSFSTPALLGSAEPTVAELRVPPFRSLLRSFWRVVYAADGEVLDTNAMLSAEQQIFGGVGGRGGGSESFRPRRSLVELAITNDKGKPTLYPIENGYEFTPKPRRGSGELAQRLDYLGYPRVTTNNKVTSYKQSLLYTDKEFVLRVAWPATDSLRSSLSEQQAEQLFCALELMSLFGTVGNRSRHGYGSFCMFNMDEDEPFYSSREKLEGELSRVASKYLRSWDRCFGEKMDMWPRSFASLENNSKLSVFMSEQSFSTIVDAMKSLSEVWSSARKKMGSDKEVLGSQGKGRDVCASERWPSQLRAKIFPIEVEDRKRQFVVVLFQLPYGPQSHKEIWRKAHNFLFDNGYQPLFNTIGGVN